MILDLIIASAVTVVFGTAFLELWFRFPFAGRDPFAILGVLLSIAAGPYYLWKKGRQPLVPIAAIYCVLMVLVLLFIEFNLAWSKGLVDL